MRRHQVDGKELNSVDLRLRLTEPILRIPPRIEKPKPATFCWSRCEQEFDENISTELGANLAEMLMLEI